MHIITVDLTQADCQIFLQQRWVYSESAENCSSGSATMASNVQVSTKQEKESAFIERRRKLGGLE